MTDTNQLPPHTITIHDHPEPHIMQWSDLELAAVKRYAEQYALQARAQVQGEAFGYIHHFAAHDECGVLIDTTWEADGCADPLPHPTFPSMWKWTHCAPFYTTPQPAQATQAEVTDEQIAACVKRASTYGLPFVGLLNPGGTPSDFSKRFTAEILALRPERVPMPGDAVDAKCLTIIGHLLSRRERDYIVWRMAEAHHGINAQAKKETP